MPVKSAVKKVRRATRVRTRIAREAIGRPRLSIHRTNCHIYAQVIDDLKGHTLAAASTQDKELKGKFKANKEAATAVGKLVAQRATKAGVKDVVFDRGSYLYHGRVKALAEAAREAGLSF
jgi:large subunit ribosomal protein L18